MHASLHRRTLTPIYQRDLPWLLKTLDPQCYQNPTTPPVRSYVHFLPFCRTHQYKSPTRAATSALSSSVLSKLCSYPSTLDTFNMHLYSRRLKAYVNAVVLCVHLLLSHMHFYVFTQACTLFFTCFTQWWKWMSWSFKYSFHRKWDHSVTSFIAEKVYPFYQHHLFV